MKVIKEPKKKNTPFSGMCRLIVINTLKEVNYRPTRMGSYKSITKLCGGILLGARA